MARYALKAIANAFGLRSLNRTSVQLMLLKSKIHRATVTGASLDYEGSLTVSADIAQTVGLLTYEKILVGNLQNGERFETYVIYGAPEKV